MTCLKTGPASRRRVADLGRLQGDRDDEPGLSAGANPMNDVV